MKIKDAMTREAHYVSPVTNLREAARKMAELDCGFLPIGDENQDRLQGVITDRDITLRAVAIGLDPDKTTVDDIKTEQTFYCYEDEDIASAIDSMGNQLVYRLVVLDNEQDKRLSGIISLGDIMRHDGEELAIKAAKNISQAA